MNLSFFVNLLPAPLRTLVDIIAQILMAGIAVFMTIWGTGLVEVTWHNSIPDFPFLSVGVTYLPIPVGGVCLLMFIIERLLIGTPPDPVAQHEDPVSTH